VALLLGPDPVDLRRIALQSEVAAETGSGETKTLVEREYHTGDTEGIFEKASSVVEGSYTAAFQDPWPSDPLGAAVQPGPGDSLTIHVPSQWPGFVRDSAARVLNIKPSLVEVRVSRLEIHLDGRVWTPSLLACQAALGAKLRNKPVKLILKREEDFLFFPKTVRGEIHIQSALGKRNQLLGSRIRIKADLGAFGIFGDEILDRIALGALGSYNHGAVSLHAQGLSSPIPPAGALAGFGLAQGFFAAECHASRIADTLGEDPAEWRKSFFLRRGKKLPIGFEIQEDPPLSELMDTAAAMGITAVNGRPMNYSEKAAGRRKPGTPRGTPALRARRRIPPKGPISGNPSGVSAYPWHTREIPCSTGASKTPPGWN
jgi:CO/xanthine dehydrogenase Mo-binding subunit